MSDAAFAGACREPRTPVVCPPCSGRLPSLGGVATTPRLETNPMVHPRSLPLREVGAIGASRLTADKASGLSGFSHVSFYVGTGYAFPASGSHSQVGQDLLVAQVHGSKKAGFYIDLASNDAVALSNTLMLERDYQWRGVCIEANPTYFWKLASRKCHVVCGQTPTPLPSHVAAAVGYPEDQEVNFVFRGTMGGIVGKDMDNKPASKARLLGANRNDVLALQGPAEPAGNAQGVSLGPANFVAPDEKDFTGDSFDANATYGGAEGAEGWSAPASGSKVQLLKARRKKADTTQLRMVPLHKILDLVEAPRQIDYLSLDVEGAEWLVMEHFAWDRYIFLCLTVERPSCELTQVMEGRQGYIWLTTKGNFGD
eukprot:gene4375-4639_t